MSKRPKTKRKTGKADRSPERAVITGGQATLNKLLEVRQKSRELKTAFDDADAKGTVALEKHDRQAVSEAIATETALLKTQARLIGAATKATEASAKTTEARLKPVKSGKKRTRSTTS